MKHAVALAIVLALGAGAAHAKSCTDPTTHKFVKCTAATAPAAPASTAPAKKPSMLSGLMRPKTASSAPAQSPAPTSSTIATGGAPHCSKGKVCGHSCIAMDKVCHKPS